MKESNYNNPELRPFGAFVEDLDTDQRIKYESTMSMLLRLECAARGAGYTFVSILYSALSGRLTPKNAATGGHCPVSAYYNTDTGNWVVLEWNKVRGICEREYRHVAFMKKILKDYDITSCGWESNDVVDFEELAPHIPRLFPKLNEFEIKVIDKPSEMYTHAHIRSCMVNTEYVQFYDIAPCKGLMVYYKGESVSRTLLWTLQDGRKALGRIYDNSSHGAALLTAYALDNGYLAEMPSDAYVVAPVCNKGIPYLDDLGETVLRVGNEIHLFASYRYANKMVEKIGEENIIHRSEGYSQRGNDKKFRIELVEYNGRLVNPMDLVEIDGVIYNHNDYVGAEPSTLIPGITDNDLFRYWKGDGWTLIYGRELCVVNDQVVLRKEIITSESGVQHHYLNVQFMMDINDAGEFVFKDITNFMDAGVRSMSYMTCFIINPEVVQALASKIPSYIRKQFHMLDEEEFNTTVVTNMRMDFNLYHSVFMCSPEKFVPARFVHPSISWRA